MNNGDSGSLVHHCQDIAAIPSGEIPALLLRLAATQSALVARLLNDAHNKSESRPPKDQLLTIPEVATRLSVPAPYAYDLARRSVLPTVRFGKYVRIRASDLEVWLKDNQKGAERVPGHTTSHGLSRVAPKARQARGPRIDLAVRHPVKRRLAARGATRSRSPIERLVPLPSILEGGGEKEGGTWPASENDGKSGSSTTGTAQESVGG
ncbi:MAG: helix-turn-helix domain-containing protein [Nitrospirota bacterium]